MTPGAAAAFEASGDDPLAFFIKHVCLDPGDLDAHDIRENQLSLEQGFRILSAYRLTDGTRIWIITEANRSSTCFFLSSVFRKLMQRKLRLDQGACVLTIDWAQETHHLLQCGNLKVNVLQLVPHRPGGVKQLESYIVVLGPFLQKH